MRSLYFMLAGVMDRFHYLKLGLSIVLVFIGGKMLAGIFHYHMDTALSLAVVAGVLLSSVVFSLLRPRDEKAAKKLDEAAAKGALPGATPDDEAEARKRAS